MSITLTKPQARSTPPKGPLLMAQHEIDELMKRYWQSQQHQLFANTFTPAIDLSESDKLFELRMDLPGMQASEFDVQVRGNTVTLSGSRREEKSEMGKTFHRLERRCGAFSRTITLPGDVKEEEVTARYEAGVVIVTLPKCERLKARRIEVEN